MGYLRRMPTLEDNADSERNNQLNLGLLNKNSRVDLIKERSLVELEHIAEAGMQGWSTRSITALGHWNIATESSEDVWRF